MPTIPPSLLSISASSPPKPTSVPFLPCKSREGAHRVLPSSSQQSCGKEVDDEDRSFTGENDFPSPTKLRLMATEADWPRNVENAFVDLMAEEVIKGNMKSSTFSKKSWDKIEHDLFSATGKRYNLKQMKSKFNRLRSKYRSFKKIASESGFGWNSQIGCCDCTDAVWDAFVKAHPECRLLRNKPCENYDNLCVIFEESTATGQYARSSTQEPITSQEERQMQDDFLNTCLDMDGDMGTPGVAQKRQMSCPSSGPSKKSKSTPLNSALDAWTSLSLARVERVKGKGQASNAEATSQFLDSSQARCIEILEAIPDVEAPTYFQALHLFLQPDIRAQWVAMSPFRREQWLVSIM